MKKILIAALFLCCATFTNAQNLVVSDSASTISPEQMQTIETYKSTCAQKVEENWRKSNIKHDDVTIKITFKSLQDGTIDDLELEIPSKYEQNNKAAIKAIEDAAKKILENDANIKDIYIEQLYTLGNPKRDPRMRIVSVSYMALIDKNKLNNKISKKDLLFNVSVLEDEKEIFVTLDNGEERIRFKIKKTLKEKT